MTRDSTTTSPSAKARGKRAELESWLRRTEQRQVGELEFEELRRHLAPISESYLRKLLRESGVPLSTMARGVWQQNLEELELSLTDLLHEYQQGDAARRMAVRRLVITAKDHARWAARRGASKMSVSKKSVSEESADVRGEQTPEAHSAAQTGAAESKQAQKEEMVLWLVTWLENPPLFADWVRLRRSQFRGP